MPLNPEDTYVHLAGDGMARTTPGGAAFWSLPPDQMSAFDQGWLVSEFVCTEDWSNWEMHPHGDEFVYLLSGDVELVLELPAGARSERITGRGAQVVPRGVWHTAKVFAPSRLLFVTRGDGTQHRPVVGVASQANTRLRPMADDEFARWRAQAVPAYAQDKVRTGRWSQDEAAAKSEQEFAALLPGGLHTAGHTLFTIESDAGQGVGALWVARAERVAGPIGYVFDLVVWHEHRRQGHAARAMKALETEALALGFGGLALNVFGHNPTAQRLYAKLGYELTHINMFKPLAGGSAA
jgi:GNAT superfamily N-acetyltransferase/mannose-6-phosphate isomerase-like protein (cupin superfamily)